MAIENNEKESLNFLEEIVETHLTEKKYDHISTRFPPEPNGYLHIGHAKSICLNFGLADKYGGTTNLRFDDTNPSTEDVEYVDSIREDVRWLGFQWENEFYASDYFDKIYDFAVHLIQQGKAYVDFSTPETIAAEKGTPTQAGQESQYRDTPVAENLALFERMKKGEFKEGECILRAKVDMAAPNMQLRDPIMYRIKFAHHHRTGNKWCIYPMYDFAHGQSDAIENITHSICTLEFESHRPLYNWYIEQLGIFPSHQYEFARLNLTYTVMSKRKLLQLVQEKHVTGWNDPRMPTISGLRRRGYTPESLRNFAKTIGIQRRENMIDVSLLEFCVREDLNKTAKRVMVVLDPIKVVITNYPKRRVERLRTENNPEDPNGGTRELPFFREIYIDRDDFMENPPKKYFRLSPTTAVRLKSAYIIKYVSHTNDENGNTTEIQVEYFPNSKSGEDTSGIAVKGVIHWVSAKHAVKVEARMYDRLFTSENPMGEAGDFKDYMNPNSLTVISEALAEPSLKKAKVGERFQFIRKGYFATDLDSTPEKPVFNLTVGLKDSWAKEQKKK
jgi:glutaminyl-tRNA synthetase